MKISVSQYFYIACTILALVLVRLVHMGVKLGRNSLEKIHHNHCSYLPRVVI